MDRDIGIAIICYKTGMGSTKLEGCPKKKKNITITVFVIEKEVAILPYHKQ